MRDFSEGTPALNLGCLGRLAPGLCLKSYAFICAESYGISPSIVKRAMQVSAALSSFNILEIMDAQMSVEDEKELKESEDIVRRMLQTNWESEAGSSHQTAMSKLAHVLKEAYVEEREDIVKIRRATGRP